MSEYVNNKEFYAEMVSYLETCKAAELSNSERPQLTPKIGNAITQIAHRMSSAHNFSGYSFKSEMIQDGILKCVEKIHKFDPTRGENVFAYASQIIFNSFVLRIKKENHQSSVKARLIREKMSSEFIQNGVDADQEDGSNSFTEFLKEHDCYTDYYVESAERQKLELTNPKTPTMKHRNKTPYPTKVVKDIVVSYDLSGFEE